MTSLLSTLYLCATCGHRHVRRHRHGEKLYRRWVIRCTGRCQGKRRPHYPAQRPLTGDYA